MKHISSKRIISFIERLSFFRSTGSEGENRAFGIIEDELSKSGIICRYESFSGEWLQFSEGYIKIQNKYYDISPLINPIWGNRWMPIPKQLDCTGVLTKSTETSLPENSIAVFDTCDINRPCLAGAVFQLFASDIDHSFVPYWCISNELIPSAWIDRAVFRVSEYYGHPCQCKWSYNETQKTFKNMVADIPGSKYPDQICYVGAHIDTFPNTIGVNDNASGCARLVELARYFVANRPLRTIRLIWFTGEELDRRGSQAYVQTHYEELQNALLYLNVDGGVAKKHGEPIGIITADSNDFATRICSSLKEIEPSISINNSIVKLDMKNISTGTDDAAAFSCAGVPTIYIKGKKLKSGPTSHLPTDTVDELSSERISQMTLLALSVLEKELNK